MKAFDTAPDARNWLSDIRDWSALRIAKVPLDDCENWYFREGRLVHETGRFFSVAGIRAEQDGTLGDYAMVDQPEVGWLGFIIRVSPEGIEWLVQAKTEPGNVADTHLAPSLQATRSNYMCFHGGRPTAFLDLFERAESFVSDGPHSEQGTRFLWKFNRNTVLALSPQDAPDVSGLPQWEWCAGQALREMLSDDYRVNTDARSVIATAPWALWSEAGPLFEAPCLAASYGNGAAGWIKSQVDKLVGRIDPRRTTVNTLWQSVALDALDGFRMTDSALIDPQGHPAVAFYHVDVTGREVDTWCQPFLLQTEDVLATLLLRVTDNGAEVFVRSYTEIGFGNRQEFGPSLHSAFAVPRLMRDWTQADALTSLLDLKQSDEGGRFMHVKATYRIALVADAPERTQYPFGKWIPLSVLEELVSRPGVTTNELRTIASMILSKGFDAACRDL